MLNNKIQFAIAVSFLITSCWLVYYFALHQDDTQPENDNLRNVNTPQKPSQATQEITNLVNKKTTPLGICPLDDCTADFSGEILSLDGTIVTIVAQIIDGELVPEPTQMKLQLTEESNTKHFSAEQKKYIAGDQLVVGDFVQFTTQEDQIINATVMK